MTTPHAVIEGMLSAVDAHGGHNGLGKHVDMTVWPDALRSLGRSVHFDLGEARPTEEHEDFCFDLFERDMMRFPFPVTFWTAKASPNTAMLVSEFDPPAWRPTGDHAGGAHGVGLLVIGQMVDRSGGRSWYLPLLSGRMSVMPAAIDGAVRFGWRGLTNELRSRKTGAAFDEDRFSGAVDKAWRLVCGATAMLMTPDVEQKIHHATDKLNMARAKKGKPPIGERRTIVIKPYAVEALTGKAARDAFDERRGPKPHMRRGHFRKIFRGQETERIVPVAPCVVGVTDDAGAAVSAKQYVVKE